MKYNCLIVLLFSIALLHAGEPYFTWYRVMTDSATPETAWAMTSYDKVVLSKTLNLPIPAASVQEAAFEYEISVSPFDTQRKAHISSLEHPWGDILIKVNGRIVFCEPAGPHIQIGTHVIKIPVDCLKDGENLFQMHWATIKREEAGKRRYGQVYVACDVNEKTRNIKSPKARLAAAPETLRFRLLVR